MGPGSKLLREPLIHFLLIGAALFFVYYTTADRSNFNQSKDIIVISPSDIDRLAYLFEKTWQRPPNVNIGTYRFFINLYVRKPGLH